MLKIFSAANLTDASLVQGLLLQAGIETRIFNEYAQGGLGELPFTQAYPEIWLEHAGDASRALALIRQFEQGQKYTTELCCPHCSEANPATFEVCWRCATPLDASQEVSLQD